MSTATTVAPAQSMLGLLQAAPLVHQGAPVDTLDLKSERDAILGALRRAGRRLDVVCDFCTTRNLRALLTDGCRLLHYSGHGFSYLDRSGTQRARLAFEDGLGGTHALEVEKLTDLVAAGAESDEGRPPLDFVFVSACHGAMGGEAFVAAGVPHVVAVRREAQLQDKAACAFADQFYFALFKGKTVQGAFDIAKQAVSNDPAILRAEYESDKFLLLPAGADHAVALCRGLADGPLVDLSPHQDAINNLPAFFPLQFVGRQVEWQQLVAAAVGQEKRLLTLIGPRGMGKTSLALAAAHYLYERSTFPGGVLFVKAEGVANATELSASILAALAEARAGAEADESGSHTPPPVEREASSVEGGMLPSTLRRLGRCLLLVDHLELGEGGGHGASAITSLLQSILQRAPDVRLFLTSTEPLALPGVSTRQVALAPMPAKEAGRLFKALAPRPITRAELGCDDPAELKAELSRLIAELAPKIPQLEDFQSAAALHRELTTQSTLLQLDTPPVSASGHAALVGFLSLPRMLASHPALAALHGNPKAISLAVSLLLPDAVTPRSIRDVGALLERQSSDGGGGGGGSSDGIVRQGSDGSSNGSSSGLGEQLTEACRQVLDQLQQILHPSLGSPSTPPEGKSPPSTPPRGSSPPPPPHPMHSGVTQSDLDLHMVDMPSPLPNPAVSSEPVAMAGQRSREKLHPSLVLKKDEFMRMMSADPKFLGSGQIGAVYDVDLVGTRVACKRFHESQCSSSAFQREAMLLADLRHPNIVQLIKVACRPPLCIVTELLVCSLHALLHHGAGGELRNVMLAPGMQQLKTVMHIARGMNYLHTLDPPVLHRNLKSQNLLIDDGGKVKIADFGWSRLKTFDAGKTFFHGWQWVAPEILWGGKFTEAADVYSFSMVAWEVLCKEIPFKGLNPVQIANAVRDQKFRPPIPADAPPGYGELLEACWTDDPEQRFNFTKILGRMNALVAMSSADGSMY